VDDGGRGLFLRPPEKKRRKRLRLFLSLLLLLWREANVGEDVEVREEDEKVCPLSLRRSQ
jgi:hypothetical protein